MPPNVRTRSMNRCRWSSRPPPAGVIAARSVPARLGRGRRAGRARGRRAGRGGQFAAASRSGSFGLLSGARPPLDSPPCSFSAGSPPRVDSEAGSSFSQSLPGSPGSFRFGSGSLSGM